MQSKFRNHGYWLLLNKALWALLFQWLSTSNIQRGNRDIGSCLDPPVAIDVLVIPKHTYFADMKANKLTI